ncbi:MAG: VOC family protein [Dysgonomonas sp.]|nr:VOC family protein [Dysgonomonas sp.]
MKNVEPYLIFNGNCEKAFTFYESVFDVKITGIMKYKDIPEEAKKNVAASDMERIIHVLLPISNQVSLMGSDSSGNMEATVGDNVSLTINAENETEARRIFNKLSEGGKVTMPLEKTFFADLYAMFTDKFGINWMVIYTKGK